MKTTKAKIKFFRNFKTINNLSNGDYFIIRSENLIALFLFANENCIIDMDTGIQINLDEIGIDELDEIEIVKKITISVEN